MRRVVSWCLALIACVAILFAAKYSAADSAPVAHPSLAHSNGLNPTPGPPPQWPLVGPGPAIGGTTVVTAHAAATVLALRFTPADPGLGSTERALRLLDAHTVPPTHSVPLRI